MGLQLLDDLNAFDEELSRIKWELDIHPENWARTTKRQPGVAKQVSGYGGQLRLTGKMEKLLPVIELAQYAHAGGECALGFGAFEAVILP